MVGYTVIYWSLASINLHRGLSHLLISVYKLKQNRGFLKLDQDTIDLKTMQWCVIKIRKVDQTTDKKAA